MHEIRKQDKKNVYLLDFYFQMIEIKEIFEEIVSLDTSELRFGSVQSFPPPYLHKEPV